MSNAPLIPPVHENNTYEPRDLSRAKDLEGLGEWDKAAAIYRRYVDLDPGPKGHVRERLLDVMRRSGAPPT